MSMGFSKSTGSLARALLAERTDIRNMHDDALLPIMTVDWYLVYWLGPAR